MKENGQPYKTTRRERHGNEHIGPSSGGCGAGASSLPLSALPSSTKRATSNTTISDEYTSILASEEVEKKSMKDAREKPDKE